MVRYAVYRHASADAPIPPCRIVGRSGHKLDHRSTRVKTSSACVTCQDAAEEDPLEVLSELLCYLDVEEARIPSYHWKDPSELQEMDPSGASNPAGLRLASQRHQRSFPLVS